jgi:hypothetical protein
MVRHLQHVLEKAKNHNRQHAQELAYTGDHNHDASHRKNIAILWDALIRREPGMQVGWLAREHFVSGLYYRDASLAASIPHPKVIINNWIIGTTKQKQHRAQLWNHWFLHPHGHECDDAAVKRLEQPPPSLLLASSSTHGGDGGGGGGGCTCEQALKK